MSCSSYFISSHAHPHRHILNHAQHILPTAPALLWCKFPVQRAHCPICHAQQHNMRRPCLSRLSMLARMLASVSCPHSRTAPISCTAPTPPFSAQRPCSHSTFSAQRPLPHSTHLCMALSISSVVMPGLTRLPPYFRARAARLHAALIFLTPCASAQG